MDIYYINLAGRADRRAFMQAQFDALGLPATRTEAVTPNDLSPADCVRPINPGTGLPLPEAAFCCGLSHLRACEALLASSAPWAVIFEDDAVLSRSLPEFLIRFEQSPPDVQIVRLEAAVHAHLTLWPNPILVGGVALHRYVGWDRGAAGYLISREAARLALDDPDARHRDIDVAFFNDTERLSKKLKPVQVTPALCIQAGNLPGADAQVRISDLLKTREQDRLTGIQRFANVLDRDVVQASRKAWHRFVRGGTRTKVEFKPD